MMRHVIKKGIPPISPRNSADMSGARYEDGGGGSGMLTEASGQVNTAVAAAPTPILTDAIAIPAQIDTVAVPIAPQAVRLSAEAVRDYIAAHRIPDLNHANVIHVPIAEMPGWVARIDYNDHGGASGINTITQVRHPAQVQGSSSEGHNRPIGGWVYEAASVCSGYGVRVPTPDYDMDAPPSNWNWRISEEYLDDRLAEGSRAILNRQTHQTSSKKIVKRVSWFGDNNMQDIDTDTETLKYYSSSTPSPITQSTTTPSSTSSSSSEAPQTSLKYYINSKPDGKSLEEILRDFEYIDHF